MIRFSTSSLFPRSLRRVIPLFAALFVLTTISVSLAQTPAPDETAWKAEERNYARAKEAREIEEHQLKKRESCWSIVGGCVTIIVFGFGVLQYYRSEKWKRTEFAGKEMESFFNHPDIRNVLTMIDWAPRRINLFYDDKDPSHHPIISREMQISALIPHTLLSKFGSDGEGEGEADGSDQEGVGERKARFTPVEAKIRDAYDSFLDRLELLGAHVEEKLIDHAQLRPYLGYWINDIADFTEDPLDAAWTCSLFRYIDTYGYSKVLTLFAAFEKDISVSGQLYQKLLAVPGTQKLMAEALSAR